jgi:hypothetical protein
VCALVHIIHYGDYYAWFNGCMHMFIYVPTHEFLAEL